jgi:hypothetical protein
MDDGKDDQTTATELSDSELDNAQGGASLTQTTDAGDTPQTLGKRLQNAWKQMSRAAIP